MHVKPFKKSEIFQKISDDVICLAQEICKMDELKYEKLLNKLDELVQHNLRRIDRYYKENTFLNNLIHN